MNHLEIVILDANQKTLDELAAKCKPLGAIKVQKVKRIQDDAVRLPPHGRA